MPYQTDAVSAHDWPLLVHDLAYGYPGRRIGHGVRLSVATGEVVAVLGPNGCGKSTLFQTILGLLPVYAGEVRVGGHVLGQVSRAELARVISYVPQAQPLAFSLAVREVVLMGRTQRWGWGAPQAADWLAVDDALASLGINALADAVFSELSGGERQLVLIARALAQAAPVVVLDEPTASLDFGHQLRVLSRIRQLATGGASVLWATHDPDHALAYADRVLLLKDGGVMAYGAPATVLTADRLSVLYGVAVSVAQATVIDVNGSSQRAVCVPSAVDATRSVDLTP